MTKIMTIIGTRPEIIKMSMVIVELDKNLEHILVHTGQNYDFELNEIFFNDLGVRKPDYFLDAADENTAKTIANVISKSDEIFQKENPDALLLYGDTNSCLAVISAKRRKIPIFHFEAGNRCFDLRVPEEINRKIVDHTSDINFVLTEHARRYLIMEGIRPDKIFKTGSHMYEVIENNKGRIEQSKIIEKLKLKKDNYFLVSIHREENIDDTENFKSLMKVLENLWLKYKLKIIVTTHPRTRKKIEKEKINISNNVQFCKPFGFFDYMKLQQNSFCVLSDSGTITEESSIMKFPAINIRNSHERPEGMDYGSVIMAGIDSTRIEESIDITTNHYLNYKDSFNDIPDYKNLNVSKQVTRTILSYIDSINRDVWKKKS
jgi:UDP-N-acetylglucosamine 2-epimerase (non-hydrolysing)